MRRVIAPATIIAGMLATIVSAAVVGMTWHDSLRILGIAALGALVAAPFAVIGFAVTRRLTIATQVGVIACVAVLVSGAGVIAAAHAMFVSDHDAQVLVVVLLAGATAGTTAAFVFARRFGAAHEALQHATRRIGAGELGTRVALRRPASAEMTALARDLDSMSQQLAAARAREAQLDGSRRELVASLSHDLRAPIAGLIAIAEALQDGVVTDAVTVDGYLTTLRTEARRLADLVDQLLELSLLDAGAAPAAIEPIHIGDLVSDAIAAALPLADHEHIAFHTEVRGDYPVIDGDARGVGRVLANLLDNAIRHTPPDGAVTVDTTCDADAVVVSVLDTCGGIPDDDLPRVFDVSFRGDAARTPDPRALGGMGLTIALGIAHAHGGSLTVRNQPDGCCFTLRLPRARHDDELSMEHAPARPVGPILH
jgi:signal transduction histidine kinase